MIEAIVYTSNTGNTERYAKILGHETELPILSLAEAKGALTIGTEIIYLGWVMANGIQGYPDAARHFRIRMVCAVGIGETGSQVTEIRKKNNVPASVELYTLQGGFYLQKLHGVQKLMMRMMVNTVQRTFGEKAVRTPAEEDLLDLMTYGGSRVSLENLMLPLEWCRENLLVEQKPNRD